MRIHILVRRLAPAAAMATLGLFLLSRIWTGTLLYYINARFAWLTLLGGVGCILVALGFAFRSSHEHVDHEHSSGATPLAVLLLLLPVGLGLLIPPQPLGAAAMTNREIKFGGMETSNSTDARLRSAPAPGSGMVLTDGTRSGHNILDWIIAFEQSPDLSSFEGQETSLIGFVFHDERFPGQDRFMLSRFVVSCCVADALAVGILVRSPNASSFSADQWVEVKGRFSVNELEGETLPVLDAESIAPIATPDQPYLFF